MDELTLGDVNAAIARHLKDRPRTIAIVAAGAATLTEALTGLEPTPIEYESEMAAEILTEDEAIAAYSLALGRQSTRIVPLDQAFAS